MSVDDKIRLGILALTVGVMATSVVAWALGVGVLPLEEIGGGVSL